jgi:hypothetical protein
MPWWFTQRQLQSLGYTNYRRISLFDQPPKADKQPETDPAWFETYVSPSHPKDAALVYSQFQGKYIEGGSFFRGTYVYRRGESESETSDDNPSEQTRPFVILEPQHRSPGAELDLPIDGGIRSVDLQEIVNAVKNPIWQGPLPELIRMLPVDQYQYSKVAGLWVTRDGLMDCYENLEYRPQTGYEWAMTIDVDNSGRGGPEASFVLLYENQEVRDGVLNELEAALAKSKQANVKMHWN